VGRFGWVRRVIFLESLVEVVYLSLRGASAPKQSQRLPCGVYPELCEILRFAQNDTSEGVAMTGYELLNNLSLVKIFKKY